MRKNDKLLDCRNKIDAIDSEIVKLLAARFDLAKEIAEYKKTNNLPVFQSGREDEILRRISEQLKNGGKEYEKYILELYRIIMEMSKDLQK